MYVSVFIYIYIFIIDGMEINILINSYILNLYRKREMIGREKKEQDLKRRREILSLIIGNHQSYSASKGAE